MKPVDVFTYVAAGLQTRLMAAALVMVVAVPAAAQVRIVQTNSGNTNNVHLIDPATQRIVGEVANVPINHGAAASPDGRWLYFSSEAEQTLHVVDAKTLQTTKKIPLSGRPNNVSISRDGRRVYIGIVSAPGAVDVIDTGSLERVKSIPTKGGIHNVYVTPDGQHVVAGSIAGRLMTVIDAKTEEPIWTLFNEGVRPIAFERNPDGSTRRLFVQISELHGFAVVDFAARKEVARVMLPNDIPAEKVDKGPFNASPSHGLGVAPDGKTPVGDQPAERARLRLLAPGHHAARTRRSRRPPRLGDVHAGQQDGLHLHREHRFRHRRGRGDPQGSRAHHRGRRAETQHNGGDEAVARRLRASGVGLQV